MQAWELYLDEMRRRSNGAERQQFGRREELGEAAHGAYQAAADRLTREHGWTDEHTLVVMRGLNAAVKDWLDRGSSDWDELGAELQRREAELGTGFGKVDGRT